MTEAGRAYLEEQDAPDTVREDRPATRLTPPSTTQSTGPRQGWEIVLPVDLRGAHPLVRATRKAATGLCAGDDGRIQVGPEPGVAHLTVSRALLRRALLILHALTREALQRGWAVTRYAGADSGRHPGIAIRISDHDYPVEVHEQTERLAFTKDEIAAWRRGGPRDDRGELTRRAQALPPSQLERIRPNGQLRLVLPNGYGGGRANWSEGQRGPLEHRLESILCALESRAREDDAAGVEQARRREAWEREWAAREELKRREQIEHARSRRLLSEVAAWRTAADLRAYLAALEQRLSTLDEDERTRLAEWISWAREWTERSDPVQTTASIVGFDDRRDQFHSPSSS